MTLTITIPSSVITPHVRRIDMLFQTLDLPLQTNMVHHQIYQALGEYLYHRLTGDRDQDVTLYVDTYLMGQSITPERYRPAINFVGELFDYIYREIRGACNVVLERIHLNGEELEQIYFTFPSIQDTLVVVFEAAPLDNEMHVPLAAIPPENVTWPEKVRWNNSL